MHLFSWIKDMKVKNHACEIFNFLEEWKMFISLNPVCSLLEMFALRLFFQSTTPDLLSASSLLQKLHASKASSLWNGAAINWTSCTPTYSKLTCFWGVALVIQLLNPKCKPKHFPNTGFSPNDFCTQWGYNFYSASCPCFTAKLRIFLIILFI